MPIINGHKTNMHQLSLNGNEKKKKYLWLKKQLKIKTHFSTIQKCQNLVQKLYERGYHIFDLLEFVERDIEIEKKWFYLVYFDSIRQQFRNEKLLMFQVLFFIFMRHEFDLENIEIV